MLLIKSIRTQETKFLKKYVIKISKLYISNAFIIITNTCKNMIIIHSFTLIWITKDIIPLMKAHQ